MKKFIFPLLFIGSIIMAFIVSKTGASLTTDKTTHGILDLELAYNVSKVNHVMKAWFFTGKGTTNNIEIAKTNIWLDFLFLLFYAAFLSVACKKIALSYQAGSTVYKLGKLFAKAILIAGVFDAIENIGMLQSLHGNINPTIAMFTASVSWMKWLIVVGCLLYILINAPKAIYLWLKGKQNYTVNNVS